MTMQTTVPTHSRRVVAAGLAATMFAVGGVRLAASGQMGTPVMRRDEFDLMFIDMMTRHHEGAVAMAEVALERGEHPELVDLAEAIIRAQEAEIAQLQAWRAAWYPNAPVMPLEQMMGGMGQMLQAMPGMQHTAGMMGMGMMMDPELAAQALRAAPAPFDLAFLNAMIPHHLSALMMAEMAVQQASQPELVALAQTMIDLQEDEIATMRGWRSKWQGAATPAST